MSRETPEKAFIEAQTAIIRKDWDSFFSCLDTKDVLKIASNSVRHLLWMDESGADDFCAKHGIPKATILALRRLSQRMGDSARTYPAANNSSPEAMLQYSVEHKQIVDEYQKSEKALLKSVQNLSQFTAALERYSRDTANCGSVSSTLFVNEVLMDISIEGDKAYATRQITDKNSGDIGFVLRKGKWYVKLFAKRPHKKTS